MLTDTEIVESLAGILRDVGDTDDGCGPINLTPADLRVLRALLAERTADRQPCTCGEHFDPATLTPDRRFQICGQCAGVKPYAAP